MATAVLCLTGIGEYVPTPDREQRDSPGNKVSPVGPGGVQSTCLFTRSLRAQSLLTSFSESRPGGFPGLPRFPYLLVAGACLPPPASLGTTGGTSGDWLMLTFDPSPSHSEPSFSNLLP